MTEESTACPYLGLPDDPRSRFTFATAAHRCHVGRHPSRIDLGHQGTYCLSSGFPACKRFRPPAVAAIAPAAAPPQPGGAQPTPVADTWSRLPTSEPTLTPVIASAVSVVDEPDAAPPARTKDRKVLRRLLLLIGLLAAALLIWAVATGRLGAVATAPAVPTTPAAITASSPVARSMTPGAALSPSAAPSPNTAASPRPSASPTAVPSPSATPTRSPAARRTIHVVRPGENLSMIAAEYGVTPQAIARANRLQDPNLIYAGEKLIIPLPTR